MKIFKWFIDKVLTAFLAISIAFGFLYVTSPEAAQNLIALFQVDKQLGSAISARITPGHLTLPNSRDFGVFYNGTHRIFYVLNATNYPAANATEPYFANATKGYSTTNGTALYFYVNTAVGSTGNFTWTTTLPCANRTLCGF